jgi:hypothetical protein
MNKNYIPFWMDNITILFDQKKLLSFVPNKNMNKNQKLNAAVRFSIYFSIILYLFNSNYLVFYIPIFLSLITIYIHKYYNIETFSIKKKKDKKKKTSKNRCILPNNKNPFMNNLVSDYKFNTKKNPACRHNPQIKQKMENSFNHNLYKNVGDIYGKNNSQRQFYTMPSTTIPNDQNKFAKWLYNTPKNK